MGRWVEVQIKKQPNKACTWLTELLLRIKHFVKRGSGFPAPETYQCPTSDMLR
jgi:hypothetical protein